MAAASVSTHKKLPYDDDAHRLFLTTNERGDGETLKKLAKEKVEENTLIAVSGFFALDVACIKGTKSGSPKRIEHIIIVDRSPRLEDFWGEMKTLIKATATREEMIKKIIELLEKKKEIYFSGVPSQSSSEVLRDQLNDFMLTIKHGISWLSSNESFNAIKRIFDRNAFFFIRMDFCDSQSATLLAAQMKKNNFTTDTLYLSNIYEYIIEIEDKKSHPQLLQGYFKSAALLMNARTTVIHAPMHSHFCDNCDKLIQTSSKPGPERIGAYLSTLQATCCACTESESEDEELSDLDDEPESPQVVDKLALLYKVAVAAENVKMTDVK